MFGTQGLERVFIQAVRVERIQILNPSQRASRCAVCGNVQSCAQRPLFSGGICAYSNESNPDTVVHHGQYRLGDYFYGNSQYVNKAYNYNFDGTILDEYKKRARHVQDVKALAIAAEVVCKRMKIKALRPATDDMSSREKKIREQKILAWNNNLEGQRSSQTRYAAVHLRLGDVMQKHSHYIFSKYVPAETYEVAAIDHAADGVTAVDLYYAGSATWGVGSH